MIKFSDYLYNLALGAKHFDKEGLLKNLVFLVEMDCYRLDSLKNVWDQGKPYLVAFQKGMH